MRQSRGLRNCNPGNIRRGGDEWKGLRARQTDPEFYQFTAPKWGYRALIRTLQNYRRRHGCTDIYHLYLMARQIELPLKSITLYLGNVHIYENNINKTKELLSGGENIKFELNV